MHVGYATARVRADHHEKGAMGVDVIDAVLRVVFCDDYRHVVPERAVREHVDQLAQREVVIGDVGSAIREAVFGTRR